MLQKGDTVVMHTCIEAESHDGQIWICTSDEFKHHPNHDYTVIMLDGFSGSFQTKYLQKVNFDFSYQQFLANEKNYEKLINEHADLLHFHDTACEILTSDQIEDIEEAMRDIPETVY